jgi:hypothetical protein
MTNIKDIAEVLKDINEDNFPILVRDLCAINKDLITDELIKVPSVYAYWAGILTLVKKNRDLQELRLTSTGAALRKKYKEESGSKLTAKDLDDLVLSNTEYRDIQEEYIKKSNNYDMIKALVEALQHKKDMLVQLSANQRAESNLYK